MIGTKLLVVRIALIVGGIGAWHLTQRLLGRRAFPAPSDHEPIRDGIHDLTASINRYLADTPSAANRLLIVSSLVIDLLGLYVLGSAALGQSFQPFIGVLILFALRQICQAFCPLPAPRGMIWRKTGVPTLFVTYETASDFFFSGHTAIAVFGIACLASALGTTGIVIGVTIAFFEIAAVLVLRAHYTMDVFTGAVTALWVYHLSWQIAPTVDGWIARLVTVLPPP